MSESTEFRNTVLADQINKLAGSGQKQVPGGTKQKQNAPQHGDAKNYRTSPFSALLKKMPPSIQKSADRSKMLGKLLDDAREWVTEQALGLGALWDEITATGEGSTARILLGEQAGSLVKTLVSFLEGKEGGGDLSESEKARLARSTAIYYAAVVCSAKKNVPDSEVWRALWFLLKTGAARVTHSFPQGAECIPALPGVWVEFPHAFLDAPTTDVAALEKSELIRVSGAVVDLIKNDSRGFWSCQKAAQKSATIHSLQEFYEAPCAGIFVVQAPPLYRKEAEQFLGGGLLVVKVAGREDAGFHVSIIEVIDDCLLATFDRSSRMKDVVLRAKFASLSSGFNVVLRGERLSSLNLPLEVFGKKELNEKKMNPAPKESDDDKFRALSHIARVLKRAIRMALPPTPPMEARGGEKEKPEQKEGGAGSTPRREFGGKGEAVGDLKTALIQTSEKHRLPILEMTRFCSQKLPRGVTLASIPSVFYAEKGKEPFKDVACVLLRRKNGDKAEVYAFSPHLAELFSGKYNRLIFTRFIQQAKWLDRNKEPRRQRDAPDTSPETPSFAKEPTGAAPEDEVRKPKWASPQAKELASRSFIDLFGFFGTGKDGAITKSDVEKIIAKRAEK